MRQPHCHLLDESLEIPELPALSSDEKFFYFASSPEGIDSYRKIRTSQPGPLHLWVSDLKTLSSLEKASADLGAFYIFPYDSLTPSQIVAQGSFEGPRSFEIPDSRIQDPTLLEPSYEVLQKAAGVSPEFSVVLPFFENEDRTRLALRSWLDLLESNFELILVDDGSSSPWVKTLKGQALDRLTLLRLERQKPRQRGDSLFRAGLARNHGFQMARGEKIVFCDSDMIVPPTFFEELRHGFKTHDVLMPQRWQLSQKASSSFHHYNEIDFDRDVILGPGAYWETFQTETTPWESHPVPWKWASTFCLAVHRQSLSEVGLFKKTFVTYGFEDSELCYRLHQKGKRFLRLPLRLYHLHQPDSHSEFGNDPDRKNRLLRISADRFFRHHPSKDVYEALKEWLD